MVPAKLEWRDLRTTLEVGWRDDHKAPAFAMGPLVNASSSWDITPRGVTMIAVWAVVVRSMAVVPDNFSVMLGLAALIAVGMAPLFRAFSGAADLRSCDLASLPASM